MMSRSWWGLPCFCCSGAHGLLFCPSRSCSSHLVILFANSPFPPALYSILIISPLSCPRVCCLLSVRKHLFWSSDYLSAGCVSWHRLSALVFPCSCARLFTATLPLHLCSHPALPLDLSGGCLLPSHCLSAPLARLKRVSVRHAEEVDNFLAINASWQIFGTEFLFSLYKCILVFHLLLDSGSHSW